MRSLLTPGRAHDGALWIVQNKTKRAIEITGELAS